MANRFRITTNKKSLNQELIKLEATLKQFANRPFTESVGRRVVSSMKDLIAKGISPIRGNGRFPAYKDPTKYPGKKKAPRPVNLFLSGDFMDSLSNKSIRSGDGYNAEIFYKGRESQLKEKGHREGANGQRERPTIPEGSEEIAKSIEVEINEMIDARIKELKRLIK